MKNKLIRFGENILGFFINFGCVGYYRYVKVGTHHSMTKMYSQTYSKKNFRQFKEAFDNTKWEYKFVYGKKKGMVDNGHSEFFASIIKFQDHGYLLTSYGLKKANKYFKRKYDSAQIEEIKW